MPSEKFNNFCLAESQTIYSEDKQLCRKYRAIVFRSHFRVTPAVNDIILREVQGYIVSKHGGGTEQIEPSKQLLIFLAYMASQESLREISVQFGVGIKTVHDVVKSMSYAINTLLIRVSINELENDGPRPWIPVT